MGCFVSRFRRGYYTVYSHHFHLLHRRSTRLQNAFAESPCCRRQSCYRRLPAIRQECNSCVRQLRLGTGIFPGRLRPLQCPPRLMPDRTYAHGTLVCQRPATGRPLLRLHPPTRDGFHERTGDRMPQIGNPREDTPQRSGSKPVRTGSHLRKCQPRQRPQPAGHGLNEAHSP